MATFEQIRSRFPSARGLSDNQIVEKLSGITKLPYEDIARQFGYTEKTSSGFFGGANDLAIEAANSAAGLVSGIGNFVSPGNRFSQGIEENLIKPGEAKQSIPTALAKRALQRGMSTSEFGPQASSVYEYITENPGLAAAQAAGSFGPIGLFGKGVQAGSMALGLSAKAAGRTGLGATAAMSGAAAGGDAGGDAYQLVMNTPREILLAHPQAQELLESGVTDVNQIYEELATRAARRASVVPAIIGAVSGATGAEKALLGGTRGFRGVAKSTGAEALGEGFEESATTYSGRKAAQEYNPNIDPMVGVYGSGLMGAALGAGTALPVSLARMQPAQDAEVDLTAPAGDQITEPAPQGLTTYRPAPLPDSAFTPAPAQLDLFNQRGGLAPVSGEQIDMFGGGGQMQVPVVDERQGDLFAPAEPTFQTRISAGLLDGLGMPRQSPMYRQLLGKDMADPAQQPQIAALFDRVRSDGNISERTKAGIEGLAMQAFGGMAQQQEMFGPRGGAYPQGRPSTQQNAPGPIENILPTAPLGVTPDMQQAAATQAAQSAAPTQPTQTVTLPTVPQGVSLTADENRLIKQANAVFGIAETDAERASVAAMVQRTIDRAVKRNPAAVQTSPLGGASTTAPLPPAPAAGGVSSTPATTQNGAQTTQAKQATPQRQELSAAESAELSKILSDTDKADVKNVLPASVKTDKAAVPGRTSIGQDGLIRIRDALVQGKDTADEKTGRIVDALRFFAESYKVYSDQGGQALSRRFKIPKRSTPAQFAEEQTLEIERTAATVRQALVELGDAVGGNAKDVEAVVRLVKDMVQGKLASPGSNNKAVRADIGKLDTMLSQAWGAAKREAFMGKEPNTADIRTGAIRGSVEVKGKGKMPTLVKVAKEGIYAGQDIGTLTGLPAILHYMRTNGTPMERALSLALRETIIGQKSNIKLEFITEGKPRFDPKTNTVYLNQEESPEIILHEAFHAALQSFVYKNPNHPAVVQLKKSLKDVVGYKGQLTGKALEVQNLLKDLVAKGNELDAVLELVSYGNTLNEFRKALQSMKSDKNIPKSFLESVNSAWTALKNIASRLLGGKRSLANDVLESSLELLDKARSKTPEAGQGNTLMAVLNNAKDAITKTAAFKNWFKDSKVVDNDGNPLVVYHGTVGDFDTFSKELLGASTMTESAKRGFFFGGNADTANTFARIANRYMDSSLTPEVAEANFKAFVDSAKAAVTEAEASKDAAKIASAKDSLSRAESAFASFLGMRQNIMPVYLSMQNPLVVDQKGKSYRDEPYANTIARATAGGYDGVIIKNTYDGSEGPSVFDRVVAKLRGKNIPSDTIYVVFEPNQIKSVFNKGTFDPNTGNILEAAVSSASQKAVDAKATTAMEAEAKEAGYASASEFATKQGAWKTPTQIAFEAMGFGRVNGKDLPLTVKVKENGAKVAEWVRVNVPTLERAILNFNSKFSNGGLVNSAIDTFKFDQNTGYLQMERIAQHLRAHPELAKPFLAYMDGDSKALDGVKNNASMKVIADNLRGLMDKYIKSLPANSKERRAFENVPFSQYLLHPDSIGQTAGTTMGVAKIGELLKTETRGEVSLDEFKQYLAEKDGSIDLNDPLYQMFEETLGNIRPAGFISKAKYEQMGAAPAGMAVDTSRVWKLAKYDPDKGPYKFESSSTAKQLAEGRKIEELSAALLNTTAALSHTYASRNFFNGLLNIGRDENGEPTASSVTFDTIDEINAAFPNRKISQSSILKVSDEASRSLQIRWKTQRTGTWVQLPENSPAYGPLQGKIIPGPVWNSMIDMHDRSPLLNSRVINGLMTTFKKSKTVYNPGTHVTNVLSNVSLAILHGINFNTLGRATQMFVQFERNPNGMKPEDLALMKAFYNSGSVLGQFSSAEVKQTVYDKMNAAIEPDSDSSYMTRIKTFMKYEAAKAKIKDYDSKATEFYAAEDNVFRLAAFLNTAGNIQLRDGTNKISEQQMTEAGSAARNMFLDYDIDARAIRALRQSFLPFVSWPYAAASVLGRIAIEKPWAMTNMLMSIALIAAATGGADDEEDRKAAPEYLREKSLMGLGPYMHMRVPFMGDQENPVYFNLGKYIPMFSLFQSAQGNQKTLGIELPAFATPGGPLISTVSALNGYDPFTGKPIADPTDETWDRVVKTGEYLYNSMAPSWLSTKFREKIGDLKDEKTGPLGVEKSSLFLARTLGGLGLYQFNVEESRFLQDKKVESIKKDFSAAMNKAKRNEYSKGYPDYDALDAELDALQDRLQKRIAELTGDE